MAQIRPVWDRIVDQGLIFQPGPLENTPGMTLSYIKDVGVKPMNEPDPNDLGAPLYHEEDPLIPGKAPRTWGAKGTKEFYSPSNPVDHVITVPGYNDNGRWIPEKKEPRKLVRDKDGNVLSLSMEEYEMFPKWVAAGANGRRGNVSDYTELPDEFLSNLVEEQPKVQRSTDLQATPVQTPYKPIAPEPVLPQLEEPEVIQAEPIEPPPPVFPGVYPLVKNKKGFSNVKLETRSYGNGADRRHYVIPTMENGKALTSKQIDAMVKQHGLDKFPSFATKKEADEWSKTNHAMIDVDGRLRSTAWTQAEADAYFAKNQPAQQTAAPVTNAAPANSATPAGGTSAPAVTAPTSSTTTSAATNASGTAPASNATTSTAQANTVTTNASGTVQTASTPIAGAGFTVNTVYDPTDYVNAVPAGGSRSGEIVYQVIDNEANKRVDAANQERMRRYQELQDKVYGNNTQVATYNDRLYRQPGGMGRRMGDEVDTGEIFYQDAPEPPKLEAYPEPKYLEVSIAQHRNDPAVQRTYNPNTQVIQGWKVPGSAHDHSLHSAETKNAWDAIRNQAFSPDSANKIAEQLTDTWSINYTQPITAPIFRATDGSMKDPLNFVRDEIMRPAALSYQARKGDPSKATGYDILFEKGVIDKDGTVHQSQIAAAEQAKPGSGVGLQDKLKSFMSEVANLIQTGNTTSNVRLMNQPQFIYGGTKEERARRLAPQDSPLRSRINELKQLAIQITQPTIRNASNWRTEIEPRALEHLANMLQITYSLRSSSQGKSNP